MDAKSARRMAVTWDLFGAVWLILGVTDVGPMDWKNWANVGLGAVLLLGSGYYWVVFLRGNRKDP